MLSLLTLLLLASSATAAVAQPANAEPTKVTKLNTNTNTIHAPCHTADVDIHARQLGGWSPSSTWSEPSWVLFNAPTAAPTTFPPSPPSGSYPDRKEDNIDKIVFIAVLSTVGGSLILYGLLGCCIKAWVQRSGKKRGKGKSSSKPKRNADIEMTAGLGVNTAFRGAQGYHAPTQAAGPSTTKPRRFEEYMDEVVLTPKYPEPVYKNDFPPQPCHYPQGEGRQ